MKTLVSAGSGLLLVCVAATGNTQSLGEILRTAAPNDSIPIIVTLAEQADLSVFREQDKHARRAKIVQALRERASLTQTALQALLRNRGASRVRPLWLINGLAATVRPAVARALTRLPGVLYVAPDTPMQTPIATPGATSVAEWNLTAIRAPALWGLGFDGAGAVVANMDTGVDLAHADLRAKWRGGTDGWWDPYRHTSAPYDAIGHGTQTMGIMVGGNAGGTAIGVAPGAQWIAAKIYDDHGNTSVSVIHEAFQWLLAPSGIPGAPDAPDVVNASWGLPTVNGCDTTFERDIEALRMAGIAVAFAAGNSGPNVWTSVSPANNPAGFSVGAVDGGHVIASFSSRGASACSSGIYPDTVAPGVDVKTSDLSLGGFPQYSFVSGTSAAAPHVAGVAALLLGAFPNLPVALLEQTLRGTALDLGPAGADDAYGAGLVDAYAAYASLAAHPPLRIVTTSLPAAVAGVTYAQGLLASGGVGPYTWAVSAGGLPAGLQLAASTGVVSGAATGTTATFSVQVSDAVGATASQLLSLAVTPGASATRRRWLLERLTKLRISPLP
jgi:serine protease AprX